ARKDLHDPLDLGLAPDDRVELSLRGELGEVAPELVEQLRGFLALAGGATLLPAAARAGEHPDDLVADLLGGGREVEQDACGDAFVLADEPEQDVLGPDVVVTEAQSFAQGELENLLGTRGEGDLPGGDLLARADDADDLGANALDRDVERLEHARGKALLLAQKTEQNVLGSDVVVLELARFFLGQHDDLTSSLCKSLEHLI